jgi:hypothetical protein
MPDYKEASEFADYWRKDILSKLQHLVPPTSIGEYLAAFYKFKSGKTYGLPVAYTYSLEFLEKYKDKCMTFIFSPAEDVSKGAPPLQILYQLNPHLHGIANVGYWREKSGNEGHTNIFLVYEKLEEALKFIDENRDLIKKPKEIASGFQILPP